MSPIVYAEWPQIEAMLRAAMAHFGQPPAEIERIITLLAPVPSGRNEPLWTPDEAQVYLKVKGTTIYKLIELHHLTPLKIPDLDVTRLAPAEVRALARAGWNRKRGRPRKRPRPDLAPRKTETATVPAQAEKIPAE